MVAIGVGGADAVDVMAGFPWEVRWPEAHRRPADRQAQRLDRAQGRDPQGRRHPHRQGRHRRHRRVLRRRRRRRSRCTGKGTISNMGAEIGATTSIFPYDDAHGRATCKATDRAELADARRRGRRSTSGADDEVARRSRAATSTEVIEIDLSTLEPHIVGPHTPDLARPVSADRRATAEAERLARSRSASALIGSCTNSSYEDITRAADVARQAADNGLNGRRRRCWSRPAPSRSAPRSSATACWPTLEAHRRHRARQRLRAVHRPVAARRRQRGRRRTRSSPRYNRNFPKRNDGNADTLRLRRQPRDRRGAARSPGTLDFDPLTDTLTNDAGDEVRLDVAGRATELPAAGFDPGESRLRRPRADDRRSIAVDGRPRPATGSSCSTPFEPWDGNDFADLPVLLKAQGKCTTDHISMAGPWLRYRGHLDNISDNLFLGAINAFTGEAGEGQDQLDGRTKPLPRDRPHYHEAGQGWVVVGDENYGEGPRASTPRWSPASAAPAVIVRSLRPHPRDQPQEAGRAAADVRRPGRLRP